MTSGYRLNGMAALQAKLRNLAPAIKQGAIEDIEDAADAIVAKAVNRAPVDLGVLKQSIGNQPKNGGLSYTVFVNAEYAPYVEWGTGTKVDITKALNGRVPGDLIEYAKKFQGSGKRVVNITAQPFFFPAYFEERSKLLKKLKQTIANNL